MRYQMTGPQLRRFLYRIDRNGPTPEYAPDLDGCWLWTAAKTSAGYGETWNGSVIYAHRAAYEHWVEEIGVGMTIDHLCRVRHCVNPSHLEAVSQRTNILRSSGSSALNAAKTHCPQGHPYDETNTYITPSTGSRQCRSCWKTRRPPKGRSKGRPDIDRETVLRLLDQGMSRRGVARHLRTTTPTIRQRLAEGP